MEGEGLSNDFQIYVLDLLDLMHKDSKEDDIKAWFSHYLNS